MSIIEQFAINNLREAVAHFHNLFVQKDNYMSQLHEAGFIKPKYEALPAKYFLREYEVVDKGNDYALHIQKQSDGKRYYFPNAFILREAVAQNALGMPDNHYYVIIFRKKWLNSWGRNLGNLEGQGINLPGRILEYVDNNKMTNQSELVLILGNKDIYTVNMDTVWKYYNKMKVPLFVNQFSQLVSGLPKDLFKLWN